MNGKKIVITARNFDLPDAGAVKLLEESGFTVIDHSSKNCGTSTSEEEMSILIGDADGVITGLEPVGRKVLESCPNLKLVSRRSIGGEPPQVCRFSFCPNRKFAARYPNFAEGSPLAMTQLISQPAKSTEPVLHGRREWWRLLLRSR